MRLEAELLRHVCAIDRIGRAGQRSCAERQTIDAPARVEQPLAVALEHLDIGEQVMAESHRLRHLQVGEARHHGVRMARRPARPGHFCSHAMQRDDAIDFAAQPQAQVGRHLVVARAAGMQPLAGVADEIGQPLLDIQMHVLEFELPVELATLDLVADLRQPTLDRCEIIRADDLRAGQHRGVCERSFDVRECQSLIEAHRRGVAQHEIGHRFVETAGPRAAFRG